MKNSSVIVKLAMIAIAVAVFFTYVLPTLRTISEVQDNIALYNRETEKVSAVNSQLASLSSQIDSVSSQRHDDLLTYLPDQVNHVAVLRDLRNMSDQSGVRLEDISYENASSAELGGGAMVADTDSTPGLRAHSFEISGVGSYGSVKDLLTKLEHNKYQFDITGMELEAEDGGLVSFNINANVYQRVEVIQNNEDEMMGGFY